MPHGFSGPDRIYELIIEGLKADLPKYDPLPGPLTVLEMARAIVFRYANRI